MTDLWFSTQDSRMILRRGNDSLVVSLHDWKPIQELSALGTPVVEPYAPGPAGSVYVEADIALDIANGLAAVQTGVLPPGTGDGEFEDFVEYLGDRLTRFIAFLRGGGFTITVDLKAVKR